MTASQAGTNRLGLRSGGNSDADEKLTVLANGNVGVGTTAPTEKLTVAGRIADASGYVAPVGAIMLFAGATAPTGWLICDGRNLNRSDYPDLFAAIGTTWGNGNGGGTAFNIPDLRNRSPFGKSDSGTFAVLGATGGTETHTHTQESHSHSIWPNGGAAAANANPVQMGNPILTDSKAPNINTSSNVPPFAVVNYIVKY
jgi:microcystin-dependent protein